MAFKSMYNKEMKQTFDKVKAFRYYRMGLNSKEIAKLLGCSYRTVQNYMSSEGWKEKRRLADSKGL